MPVHSTQEESLHVNDFSTFRSAQHSAHCFMLQQLYLDISSVTSSDIILNAFLTMSFLI